MRIRQGALLAVALATGAVAPAASADGPAPSETRVYQADEAHTGRLLGAGVGASLAPVWSLDTHFIVLTPLISDGVLYVTTHPAGDGSGPTEVTALDLATGRRRWSTPLPTNLVGGARTYLALDAGRVYAVVYDAVYALDAATGAVVWHTFVDQWDPMPPLVHGGALIFQSAGYGSTLYAFRGSDGARLWSAAGGNGPPVAAGGVAFMTEECGASRVAVNLADGTRAYLVTDGCSGGAESPGAFDGRYVWAASPDATDPGGFVFDPIDGAKIAAFAGQPPAIAAPYAYLGRLDHMVAMDLQTRAQAWDTALDGDVVTAPLVVDGEVVVRTHDSVYLLDRLSGAVTWRQPVAHQDALYLTTGSRIGLAAGDGYLVVPTKEAIEVLRGDGRVTERVSAPSSAPTTRPTVARCRSLSIRLPRRLSRATVRAHHRRLAVHRRHGRLRVTVPPAVAVRGVAHLVITGRTHAGHRVRLHRRVRVCGRR
jgi:outer membrane protein assembly factor BamB